MAITPSPIIPAGGAATVAALLARLRDDTCVIERPAAGSDAGGAPAGGYVAVGSAPCRVTAPGRQPVERISGGRLVPLIDYEIRFPPDADVRSDDRIKVNGRTLYVVADRDAISHGFELTAPVTASES